MPSESALSTPALGLTFARIHTVVANGVVRATMTVRDGKDRQNERARRHLEKHASVLDAIRAKREELTSLEVEASPSGRRARRLAPAIAVVKRQIEDLSRGGRTG